MANAQPRIVTGYQTSQVTKEKSELSSGVAKLYPDFQIMLWTWFVFILLLLLLWRFAFKPILAALEKRENDIRKSVEDAERIQQELIAIEDKRIEILTGANNKAKDIIATARTAAVEAAKVIEDKARKEGQIMLENAHREIKSATQKAHASLRYESAELVIALSKKLIDSELDETRSKKLVDSLIQDM